MGNSAHKLLSQRYKSDGKPTYSLNRLQWDMKAQVEDKVKRQEYVFEDLERCPCCSSENAQLIAEKDRYGLYYPVNICESCGLVYTNPRMDQESYAKFYNNEYRRLYVGSEKPKDQFFKGQYKKGEKIYEFLSENESLPSKERLILEVGCGAGGILAYFRDQGYRIKGIDLGEEYLEYGKSVHGLDLESGFLKDISLDEKPGMVIYSHVVEHILDLEDEFKRVKSILDDSSVLYIEVPGIKRVGTDYKSDFLRYLQNAHTFHFTQTSLSNILGKCGFDLIAGNEYVRSIFKIKQHESEFKITSDYQDTLSYLRTIEDNRWKYYLTVHGLKSELKSSLISFLDLLGVRPTLRKLLGRS